MNSNISIIIPTFNEAEGIEQLLNHLNQISSNDLIFEIIIIDGGSNDNTVKIASNFKNISLFKSEKGRAKQMNLGARTAKGSILYFLHADSYPPNAFDQLILEQINKGYQAGCFKMQFDSEHWWLKLAGWFTQFNWRACRGGDQSLFITKKLFNTLGGFDESFIIYEDMNLINKLYLENQFTVIQKSIITSARRYQQNGILKLQIHFWMIYLKKWFGATPKELQDYYYKYIQ